MSFEERSRTLDVRRVTAILLGLLCVSVGFASVGWFVGGGSAGPVSVRDWGPGPALEVEAFEPESARVLTRPRTTGDVRNDRPDDRARVPIEAAMERVANRKEIR